MMLDIDVLYPRIEDRVVSQSYWSLVVTFQWDDHLLLFTIDASDIWASDVRLFPPTRDVQVPLNALNAGVALRDLNQSVLFIGL